METEKFANIKEFLNTGDLILFAGKGLLSGIIKLKCNWSHVGMVVQDEILCLWESTTLSNLKDMISGKKERGVQVVPLEKRLSTYDGEFAVRRLICHRTPEMLRGLQDFRNSVRGRPYEKNYIDLVRAAFDNFPFLDENKEDLSSLFCSELIAEAYEQMGLLPKGTNASEYDPKDWADTGVPIRLLKGARLGNEIRITA